MVDGDTSTNAAVVTGILVPTPPPTAPPAGAQLQRLEQILQRFEISIAQANDLVALEEYEVMIIADDSGSMSSPAAPSNMRVLGQKTATRWDELKETASLMVDVGACFDSNGIDIYFLNRGMLHGITSPQDPRFVAAFANPPSGSTPLGATINKLAKAVRSEKPVLLFILTDGVPDEGVSQVSSILRQLLSKKSTHTTFKVQIMACTSDEEAVGWLNVVDKELDALDVTDDYYSELKEVMKAGKVTKFTRGDWIMKAMLGPISHKFDSLDQRKKAAGNECCLIQ